MSNVGKQSGLSLIELLLSLFIAGIISSILIQTYVINKSQFKHLHQSIELQFDIKWLQDLLVQSIRSAGFTPCLNVDYLEIRDMRIKPKIISSVTFNELYQSLQINRMSEQFAELDKKLNDIQLIISPELSLHKGQSIMIADCTHAEIHELVEARRSTKGLMITIKQPIQSLFTPKAYVGLLIEEKWFIKMNKKGERAFYFQQNHSEELSSLIDQFKGSVKKVNNQKRVQLSLVDKNNNTYTFSAAVRS